MVATDTDAGTAGTPGLISGDDKEKLDGIAAGAEVNVQSNWAETDIDADSYIDNKPTITNYNLTAVSGSDRLFNPSELIFSSDGNSFTIGTDTTANLHTFQTHPTPVSYTHLTLPTIYSV